MNLPWVASKVKAL